MARSAVLQSNVVTRDERCSERPSSSCGSGAARASTACHVVDSGWTDWQHEVVAMLQDELGAIVGQLTLADVDWCAWRYLFDQGRSARAAIERALERDL